MIHLRTLTNRIVNYRFSTKLRAGSNLLTNVYTLVVGLIFVPLYINYIGIEAYGIIGAFNGITAFLWLFDFGVGTNINREMSTFHQLQDKQPLIDAKKTLELVCYGLSGIILLFLLGFIYFLANYWFQSETFEPSFLLSILSILSLSLVLQFPVAFYTSGLIGLNQQVTLNLITIFINTIKCIGAFLAVICFDDKIRAFLLFQMITVAFQLAILKVVFDRFTETKQYRGHFRLEVLKRLRQFASELFGNNVVTVLLTQSDKIILSRVLSLEEFGYYMLAFNIVLMTLNVFSSSVVNVIFPTFSRLALQNEKSELVNSFRLSTRLMSWGSVSIATMLIFFPQEILFVWTNNSVVAEQTDTLLALLAIAFGLNIVMMIPYYLQFAFGRSHVSFKFNLLALFLSIPAFIISSIHYGAIGAAACWVVMQLVYFVTFVPAIRKNFLQFSLIDWYLRDVGKSVLVGLVVGIAVDQLVTEGLSRLYMFLFLVGCFVTIAGLSFLSSGLAKYAVSYNAIGKLRSRFL